MQTVLFILSLFTMLHLNAALSTVEQPPEGGASYGRCIRVSQSGPNNSAFSFYNGCGERLWINACIESGFSKGQLVKSARDIQIGGRFTVYPFDTNVKKISWSASPYNPLIPGICALPSKK